MKYSYCGVIEREICNYRMYVSIEVSKKSAPSIVKMLLLFNYCSLLIFNVVMKLCGPGSSVGIATGYELDGPGIEFQWGEIFRTCPDRPWGQPSLLYDGYRVNLRGKAGRTLR